MDNLCKGEMTKVVYVNSTPPSKIRKLFRDVIVQNVPHNWMLRITRTNGCRHQKGFKIAS